MRPSPLPAYPSAHTSSGRSYPQPSRLIALAGLLLGACQTGDGLLLPSEGEPASISVVEGDGQSARVGEPLAAPVVVEVTDTRRRPVRGATVAFELTSAGADVTPHSATTDAKGRAQAQVVLGTTIGPQTGQARVVTDPEASGPQTSFAAMALPESANRIEAVSGADQSAPVGSALPSQLVVEVTDSLDNPVADIPISWTVEGGGSVSEASTTTDELGRASVERTLGSTLGRQATLATSEGLAGSPVTFVHTATPGDATTVVLVSGNNQTGAAGSLLPASIVVRVVDGSGNGVPQTAVTWVVSIGGGRVTPENGRTDDQGYATAQWTLGGRPGDNRLDAVVSGVGVVNIRATGTPDPGSLPARIELSGGNSQSGTVGTTLPTPLSVKVTTGSGAPAPNVTVAWAASGGGSVSAATSVTDGGGIARVVRTLGSSPGTQTTTASVGGLTGSPVTFQSTATPGAPATLSLSTQPSETARNGVRLARQPVIQIRDGAGNPARLDRVEVTVAIGSGGGVLNGTTRRTTNGNGQASFNDLSITGAPGQRTLIFAATNISGVVSNPINLTAAVTSTRITSDSPDPSDVEAPVTVNFTVTSEGPTPAGSVTVTDGVDTCTGGLDNNGVGSCPLALSTAGDRTLTATYGGGEGQLGSSGTAPHRVSLPPPPNQPPTANFTPDCTGLHCKFNDASSDSDGQIASRSWTFGDGGTDDKKDPSHDYAVPGTYTVVLTVRDDDGAESAPVSQTISVTAPNAPPQGQGDSYTTSEDTPLTIPAPGVLANDSDPNGDGLTAVKTSDPLNGAVTAFSSDGSFVYTPGPNFNGTDSFTYKVSDGSLQSGPVTVTVSVNAVNDPPVAVDDAYSTDQDAQLTVAAAGVLANDTDPENQNLSANVSSGPQNGTLALDPDGSLVYTPNSGFTGDDTFSYVANDGSLNSNLGTVTITVNAVAPPPAGSQRLGFLTPPPGATNKATDLTFTAPGYEGVTSQAIAVE